MSSSLSYGSRNTPEKISLHIAFITIPIMESPTPIGEIAGKMIIFIAFLLFV
jgi:hypothetical protein